MTNSVNLDKARLFCDFKDLRSIFTPREKFTLKDVIQGEDEKGRKMKKQSRLAYMLYLLPRIELVDNTLKPYHSKESACETPQPCQRKDGESQQGLPAYRLCFSFCTVDFPVFRVRRFPKFDLHFGIKGHVFAA